MWPKKTSKTPHHVLLISLIPLQWSIIIYSLLTNHTVYIGILNYATRVFCLGGKDKYQEKLYITIDERLNQDQSRIRPLMITMRRNITARVVTTSPNVKAMMDSMKDIRTFEARSSRFGPSIAYHNITSIFAHGND